MSSITRYVYICLVIFDSASSKKRFKFWICICWILLQNTRKYKKTCNIFAIIHKYIYMIIKIYCKYSWLLYENIIQFEVMWCLVWHIVLYCSIVCYAHTHVQCTWFYSWTHIGHSSLHERSVLPVVNARLSLTSSIYVAVWPVWWMQSRRTSLMCIAETNCVTDEPLQPPADSCKHESAPSWERETRV